MGNEQSATVISQTAALSPEARGLLKAEHQPGAFLHLLIEKQLNVDAVRFLAHYLSPRSAVWWACLCVRHTLGQEVAEHEALHAAVQMVREPKDEYHKTCRQAAKAAKLKTPAGCVALAAFHSDRSRPETGKYAGTAVLLSASRGTPIQQYFRQYVMIGMEVEAGKLPWTPDKDEGHSTKVKG